jgi:hypothetical protein
MEPVYKLVFQVPYDEDSWDTEVADELRLVTPGDHHGPHVKIYPGRVDKETGEPCAFIRCKHHSLAGLQAMVARVLPQLEKLLMGADALE